MKTWKNDDYRVPVMSWCDDIEESAMVQIDNIARHPLVVDHIVMNSDCHCGYGVPIGTVIACKGGVMVSAIGVDIGCGVRWYDLGLSIDDLSKEDLKKVLSLIRKKVPVGRNHHETTQNIPEVLEFHGESVVKKEYERAKYQMGTLGGGNHFIEIQTCGKGIFVMIHSGSRNLGYKVANHHNRVANELCSLWKHNDVVQQELSFLPVGTNEYNNYMSEMTYCVEFAKMNRDTMMSRVVESFENVAGEKMLPKGHFDIAHNYAQLESHDGSNVMVHRKGATRARKGDVCIIPGSQGSSSYVCEGLGNEKSFNSCSHGAGRKMSRTKARNTLNLQEEIKSLDKMGVIHSIRNKQDLDEAPSSYKDINVVMESQKDLVKITHKMTPIAVIKG